MRDQQSETLQIYTLVSIVFTDDLGQVSHPFVGCKITLNKSSNIENSFLWEVEKTIFREFKIRRLQYVAQYPDGTSIRTLETKTQFLRRPFQFSVNEVFRMKAEHFSFKIKVLAI